MAGDWQLSQFCGAVARTIDNINAHLQRPFDERFECQPAEVTMSITFNQFLDACDHGKLDRIEQAIAEGVDVNRADSRGWSGLLCAARAAQTKAVAMLLDAGADATHARGGGFNALHMAVAAGNEKRSLAGVSATVAIATMLLEHGTDAMAATATSGQTPLRNAACFALPELLAVLLEAPNADCDVRANDGTTPLIAAVAGSQAVASRVDVMTMLLAAGADVSLADDFGYTALHFAAGAGHHLIVLALLEAGADSLVVTTTADADEPEKYPAGQTAADYARVMGQTAVADFLATRGVPRSRPTPAATSSRLSLAGA